MVAYIDEFKDRFRGGPICRVLAASLDCGFITPRGYRMFRSRPVSRMAARHEALARDILEIHADFFMAVYGYRKTRAQLLARGWDPAEIGRDQVMNVMRESGIRCLCSISCCGFSHDDFSGLGRACRPRNGLNWMVLVSPPERTGKDYDQHAPSTVYPSFAAERGIRRVDRAENTCQRADGA